MKLWIGNMAPGTTDDELKELVRKYAPELSCKNIKREEGTGSRPGAIVELGGGTMGSAEKLARRLNGMFWKGRELVSSRMGI